jgi:hypothetical protein
MNVKFQSSIHPFLGACPLPHYADISPLPPLLPSHIFADSAIFGLGTGSVCYIRYTLECTAMSCIKTSKFTNILI